MELHEAIEGVRTPEKTANSIYLTKSASRQLENLTNDLELSRSKLIEALIIKCHKEYFIET